VEEVEEQAVARVGRDERAAALLADQDVLGDQLVDRTAQRSDADAEALGQAPLGRDGLARLPLAAAERVQQLPPGLLVQRRAERNAGCGGFGHRAARRRGTVGTGRSHAASLAAPGVVMQMI